MISNFITFEGVQGIIRGPCTVMTVDRYSNKMDRYFPNLSLGKYGL